MSLNKLGNNERKGSPACCSPRGYKELDMTERLSNNHHTPEVFNVSTNHWVNNFCLLLLLLSCISCVWLCANPWMEAHQAPLSLGFSRSRTMEWIAVSFSNAWKWKVKLKSLSRVWLFKTPWTVTYQAPPSMGFPRQEYWNGVPSPSPNFCLFNIKNRDPWL